MVIRARSHVASIPACPHGSLSLRERSATGPARQEPLDFSASCNPLGTSPAVLSALAGISPSHYPDDRATELKSALAADLSVDAEWIALGNGSVEIMWLLASAFLDPGDQALVVGPTFGEYARACLVAGAEVQELRFGEEVGFRPDPNLIARLIETTRPRLAFLCNPNNPTGQILDSSEVVGLMERCEETLLVVDEAYLPFCEEHIDLRPHLTSGRLLLLRSMTKDHGLAGLRLGYALAHPEIIDALERVRPPWNVNAAAQAAGLAALKDRDHLEEARRVVVETREYLTAELSSMGLDVVPSGANFLLVRVGDGAALRSALMERGICVRDCGSFGLPAYIRIGMRPMMDCRRLVQAMREVILGG